MDETFNIDVLYHSVRIKEEQNKKIKKENFEYKVKEMLKWKLNDIKVSCEKTFTYTANDMHMASWKETAFHILTFSLFL